MVNESRPMLRKNLNIVYTKLKFICQQAEEFIANGLITIGSLQCRVKALKPTIPLQKENKRNKESGNQLGILIEEDQVTHKVLVHDVSTNIAENDLKEKIVQVYHGVKNVKRWYSRNEPSIPTENVQIDFELPENTKTLLQKDFINIGQLYWSVYRQLNDLIFRYNAQLNDAIQHP
ncbi:unnamed protein product [Rotaria socialis]|uniref:Uncharacterized protein n=1 Tax=Rotaria socialis TaxID=392032 RepID=A0A818ELD7_9BILA|nr:unnamed protein product [Rotaria socialis]CAF4509426.1 unnamed protein product [Rotaria socialis]